MKASKNRLDKAFDDYAARTYGEMNDGEYVHLHRTFVAGAIAFHNLLASLIDPIGLEDELQAFDRESKSRLR